MPSALIPDKKHAPDRLGRVLVLGLGKSGRAAADYCLNLMGGRVSDVVIAAGAHSAASDECARAASARGAHVYFESEEVSGPFDLCIASPGISQFSDFYRNAVRECGEVISEVEFAWRESAAESRWVAITGTNGKTTTTALAAHVLAQAGYAAQAVGNIGDVCLDAVAAGRTEVYVAEVSSYQLASTRFFAPDVAVLLNITPDHLSWHGGMDEYCAAKHKVLANLASVPGAVAVLDATDDTVRATVRALRSRDEASRGFSYIPVGTAAGLRESMRDRCGSACAAYAAGEGQQARLIVDIDGTAHDVGSVGDMQVKGEHNVGNALAAAAAAIALGADASQVAHGLSTFAALEHRIEPCGSVNGVACYNDSKATNVDATLKAFSAFDRGRVVVLLGGCDKGTDLAGLVAAADDCAKAVVCFGDAGARFFDAFCEGMQQSGGALDASAGGGIGGDEKSCTLSEGPCRRPSGLAVLRAGRLEDALDAALSIACPGDSVLLSPACASFDEFTSFEHRGDTFKRLVACRMEAACASPGVEAGR